MSYCYFGLYVLKYKGGDTVPDYREMYFTLMRETEKAIKLLIAAQQKCEELYLTADDEPEESTAQK